MSTQENKQLVMQGYQKFKNGDIAGLLELLADDIEWEGARSDSIPFSGYFHGKQEVGQFFRLMDQAQETQQFEPKEIIAEGNKVVVTGQARYLVKSTGQAYDNPWVHIFTVRDGKLARFQEYNDSAAAVDAYRTAPKTAQPQKGAGPSVRH